jgi:HEAT repeat protein
VSDDPDDRRRAAAVAGHVGDEDGARRAFGDPDDRVRATALAALARIHALTARDLHAALTDPSARVRRRAAELASEHADVDLLPALDDPEPLVAEAAAFALGERPATPVAVGALARVSEHHSDPLVREAAVAALGALGEPAGLPAILRATSDKPAIRRRAVLALAPFDGPEVDAALARALEDRDWQVRQAAEDLLA